MKGQNSNPSKLEHAETKMSTDVQSRRLQRLAMLKEPFDQKEIETESERKKRHLTFFKWTGKKIKSDSHNL